ncbi:hypothetical protein JHW43_007608, partial [Diplocarpon mali]
MASENLERVGLVEKQISDMDLEPQAKGSKPCETVFAILVLSAAHWPEASSSHARLLAQPLPLSDQQLLALIVQDHEVREAASPCGQESAEGIDMSGQEPMWSCRGRPAAEANTNTNSNTNSITNNSNSNSNSNSSSSNTNTNTNTKTTTTTKQNTQARKPVQDKNDAKEEGYEHPQHEREANLRGHVPSKRRARPGSAGR